MKVARILLFLVAAWLLVLSGAQAEAPTPPRTREALLEQLLAAKDAPERQAVLRLCGKALAATSIDFVRMESEKSMGDRAKAMRLSRLAEEVSRFAGDERKTGWVLLYRSQLCINWGDLDEARAALREADVVLARAGDTGARACVKLNEGDVALRVGQMREARSLYTRSLQLAQAAGDRRNEGNSWRALGHVAMQLSEYAEARSFYKKALACYEPLHEDNMLASCYYSLGLVAYYLGEGAQARTLHRKAGALYLKGQDRQGLANCLFQLGILDYNEGEPAQALALFDKAIAGYTELGVPLGVANCYSRKAHVYSLMGESSQAMALYEKALPLYRSVGDRIGEANCYLYTGIIEFNRGANARALALYNKALALHTSIGNRLDQATCCYWLGTLSARLGDYEAGKRMLDRALVLYRAAQDRRDEANIYVQLGGMVGLRGDLAEARKYFGKALPLLRAVKERMGEATCLFRLGLVCVEEGRIEEAKRLLGQSRTIFEQIRYGVGQAQARHALARIVMKSGNAATALAELERLAPLYRAGGVRYDQSLLLTDQALCLENLGRLPEARNRLDEALELVESVREEAGSNEDRSATLRNCLETYRVAARIAARSGDADRAFSIAESQHGRSLLDLLVGGGLQLHKHLSTEERRELGRREQEVTLANSLISTALSRPTRDDAELSRLGARRSEARRALEDIEKALYAQHPELALARGARCVDAAAARAILPQDAMLIEYVVAKSETVIYAVSREGTVTVRRVPIRELDLARDVRELGSLCHTTGRLPLVRTRRALLRREELARGLFESLVKPALSARAAAPRHLVIVPDGPLFELPFQVLRREGRYLVEDFTITYAGSASLLKAALEEPSRPGRRKPTRPLLVMANPDFGSQAWVSSLRGTRDGLTPLPGTQQEAERLAGVFPEATVRTGKKAQETTFRTEAPLHRYVHVATHGLLDDSSPLYSALAFSRPEPPSTDDGFLEARELAQMELSADLLVMSACETGRGTVRPGDGVLGLLWAATVAGAPSIMVSLWKVDDTATCDLMAGFYRRLKEGRPRGQALREAQLEVMHDGQHDDPFFWAAFLLSGDWR